MSISSPCSLCVAAQLTGMNEAGSAVTVSDASSVTAKVLQAVNLSPIYAPSTT